METLVVIGTALQSLLPGIQIIISFSKVNIETSQIHGYYVFKMMFDNQTLWGQASDGSGNYMDVTNLPVSATIIFSI